MATEPAQIGLASFAYRWMGAMFNPQVIRGAVNGQLSKSSDKNSLCMLLEKNAAKRPDKIAIKYEDGQWTWAEFNAIANQYAHYFKSRGIKKGDCISVDLENRADVLFVIMGVTKIGAIASMINCQQSGDVLLHSLNLVKPKLLIFGEECIANANTIGEVLHKDYKDCLLFVPDRGHIEAPAGYRDLSTEIGSMATDNLPETQEITLGTPAFYIYTSGTTGLPKASVITHLRTIRGGNFVGQMGLRMTQDDVLYCALPLYHSNALMLGFTSAMIPGATLAVGRKFSVTRFWDECRRYDATAFCYIGELLRYLLNQPAKPNDKDHKVVKIAGNGLRPDIWTDFKERFGIDKICEFYAATEGNTAFVNLLNFDKTCGWTPGAGKAWQIVSYDVDADRPRRDENGHLIPLGVNDVGLLIAEVSEMNPYNGYSDPEATEKKLFRDAFVKGDAWFNTGDLVKRLPYGHIQFVDRVGDTFRWHGENVATTEVEAAVIKYPNVEDAVVYGVAVPGMDGRCGMLALTPTTGEKPDLDGLASHLRDCLPSYAVPRFLRLQSAAEVTGTFKHKKSTLKEEGFDPRKVDGELFFLPPSKDSWAAITEELKATIEGGEVRL